MAKGPFHFKTFFVEQDGAAMKVGTDGIVLGCWTPIDGARTILDAGAGNGYVGIMLLQRAEAKCHLIGVELEAQAASQCAANYVTQPFPAQTTAWHGRVQEAAAAHPEWQGGIDLVISNPPFFRDKPKSPNVARNLARHDDTLTMADMAKSAHDLLKEGGRLSTIWPIDRKEEWNSWATGCGFEIQQTVLVKTMRHLAPKRFLSLWRKKDALHDSAATTHNETTLVLEGEATLDYTDQYLAIVRPYLRGT